MYPKKDIAVTKYLYYLFKYRYMEYFLTILILMQKILKFTNFLHLLIKDYANDDKR